MFSRRVIALLVAAAAAASAASVTLAQSRPAASLAGLTTRAERSNFTETSRYDDVQQFLAAVDQASDLVHLTSFGYSFEGRSLPLAIVGRVTASTPAAVRASGRLRVYIQANIHAGEVEGNRFGILSETYSYLPFAERVTNNRRFLEEMLGCPRRSRS